MHREDRSEETDDWALISVITLCACQWYALPTTPGAWWGVGGNWHVLYNRTSPHTWGTTITLHILYKYPIHSIPCHACTREIWVFVQRHLTQPKRSVCHLSIMGQSWLSTPTWLGRFQQQIPLLSPTSAPGMQDGIDRCIIVHDHNSGFAIKTTITITWWWAIYSAMLGCRSMHVGNANLFTLLWDGRYRYSTYPVVRLRLCNASHELAVTMHILCSIPFHFPVQWLETPNKNSCLTL